MSKYNKYARFSTRVYAFLIDKILLSMVLTPLLSLVFGKREDISMTELVKMIERGEFPLSPAEIAFELIAPAIIVIIFWIYRGATPAKMFLKIRIVDAKTGAHPTKNQFIIRYLGYFVSIFSFGAGFIWALSDKKGQTWHDKIANTVVVWDNSYDKKDNQQNDSNSSNKNNQNTFEA